MCCGRSLSEGLRNAIENAAAIIVVLGLAVVTGYFGFAGVIGDRGPVESLLDRNAVVLGAAMSGAVLIGLFLPRLWYFSIAASWGSLSFLVESAVHQPIEALRHFFDAGNMSVWAVFTAPVLALASGYLGAYVGQRFWSERDIGKPNSLTLSRILATAIAVVLIILSAWLLANTVGFPSPYCRTRIDSFFFDLQLAVIYGGVSIGVLIYWAHKKRVGQSLRPFSIVEAGVLGVVTLAPVLAFRNSIYTMLGVEPKSLSWSWDFAIVAWFFCAASAATSAALLLYGLQIRTRLLSTTLSPDLAGEHRALLRIAVLLRER